ncbi:MAG: S-layer homology domain-containing protein [Patescibacteria group bacterium]
MKQISKRAFIAVLVFTGTAVLAQAAVFPDVPANHPNAAAIDYLTKEEIISGYPDGTFQPELPVNRAEALKILLLGSGIITQTTPQNEFPDVSNEAWFAPFVASARDRGIAEGYPDGFFRPEQTVNLVESLKMLLTTNKVALENYATDQKLFADTEERAWYNAFLNYAQKFELVEADATDKIFPATPLTRGALAEIVYRFKTRTEEACPRLLENVKTVPANYFTGITLMFELPNVFYEGETFLLRGSVTGSATHATVFFSNETGKQTAFAGEVEAGAFVIPMEFNTPGFYNFSVLPGLSGSGHVTSIEILPRECVPATVAVGGSPPVNLLLSLTDNNPTVSWNRGENNLIRIVLRQREHRLEKLLSAGQDFFVFAPADFVNWQEGSATIQVFGARSERGWSFEPRTPWVGSQILTLDLTQHHFSNWREDDLTLLTLPTIREPFLNISGTAKIDLETTAYLINPDGSVTEIMIIDSSETIPAGTPFALNLQLPEIDTYIVEINDSGGLPVLNHPLYVGGKFPLLPDFADLREAPDEKRKISVNRERAIWLRLVNEFRAKHHLSAVRLDAELSNFAQDYAEKMQQEDFFGHTDPHGQGPDARRRAAGLLLPVGENLARDTETEYAHAGLLRSAAHRSNILSPQWTRVGLGVAENDKGSLFFVQEFSTDPLTEANLNEFKTGLYDLLSTERQEQGLPGLILDLELDTAAQSWSEKMLAENSLGFIIGAESLENLIRSTGYAGSFASFVASAGQLATLVEGLSEESIWMDVSKVRVTIGLTQGPDGGFRATFILR